MLKIVLRSIPLQIIHNPEKTKYQSCQSWQDLLQAKVTAPPCLRGIKLEQEGERE